MFINNKPKTNNVHNVVYNLGAPIVLLTSELKMNKYNYMIVICD